MRKVVVLDTETTGLDFREGHRVIEVACVKLDDRTPTGSVFHEYVNPQRKVEREALEIHGIDDDFLSGKPIFPEIAPQLFKFIEGSVLVIHNAPFDLGFLNHEFKRSNEDYPPLESVCEVIDTLELARSMRPGRRNSLDALALEYDIDLSKRVLHGALLDAEILVKVYRALTGGQTSLQLESIVATGTAGTGMKPAHERKKAIDIVVVRATEEESELHENWLDYLDQESDCGSIWRKL